MRASFNQVSRFILAACLMIAASPTISLAQSGPLQYHPVTPCRLLDTRNPNGPSGGPILQDNTERSFPVQGLCSIPVGAGAVAVNVTAVSPNGNGFLTLFPTGITRPVVSNLNYQAGVPAVGNGAIIPLADQAVHPLDLRVYARVAATGGTVHMVLDVTGYFAP
jgi:hypothetical protein